MPLNPNALVEKLRRTEEELEIQSQMYYLGETPVKPPKINPNTRMHLLATRVYDAFVDTHKRSIPATEMDELLAGCSRTTINRLKKFLGIRSFRKNQKWYWAFPRRAPDEARHKAHILMIKENNVYKDEISARHRPAVEDLRVIMEEWNWQIPNNVGFELMQAAGYQRSTALKAKGILGILSKKNLENKKWMWYYASDKVITWLRDKLSAGPVPHKVIAFDAWSEMQWDWELILLARKVMGGITWTRQGNDIVWTDVNQTPPPPAADTSVEIDNTAYSDNDHEVIVDFADEEVDHELAPDAAITAVEPPRPRVATVAGTSVKLEIFE